MSFNDTLRTLTDQAIRRSLAEIEAEFQRRFGQAEAAPGVVRAYLKEWQDNGEPRIRVDLREYCEPWLDAVGPTITPLVALARQHGAREDECIVSSGDGKRFRTWKEGWSTWTDVRVQATRYPNRTVAEIVHAEDEDAWRVEPYLPAAPATDAGEG